ncbi:MAG: chorismate-binding protein [Pyrobaculum sp.]
MKIPLSKLPQPRELAHMLYTAGEDFVALLESGQGYIERSRYTLVAWGVEREYISYGVDLYKTLDTAYREALQSSHMAIGVVSYDAVAYIEPVLLRYGKIDREVPLAFFVKPRGYLLYDKLLGRAYLHGELPRLSPKGGEVYIQGPVGETDHTSFLKWVVEARRRIQEGEIFQVVLSRYEEFRVAGDLFRLYINMADLNPSPYMYFLKWRDIYLLGTSPELLVKVVGDRAETHPIAGTRPRGISEEEDIALEEELLKDEKELAEHIMLVDLARNDLGRVCRPGTVRVDELYAVEKYSRVQHLVSRVSCVMERKLTPVDVLWATHPAGTVSGAPKVRAMEIITELETRPRGLYAGALGFFSPNLSEFAIVIRTAVVKDEILRIQAGAGVVYDSTPERELKETQAKLKALREALGTWT